MPLETAVGRECLALRCVVLTGTPACLDGPTDANGRNFRQADCVRVGVVSYIPNHTRSEKVSVHVKGYLIIRSWFLPRILGVLGLLAGLSLLTFLWPPLGLRLFAFIAVLGLIGALPQIVWLLVKGVDEGRWREQAATASSGGLL